MTTDTQTPLDWSLLERAGLSHNDFAELVPCSRVSVLNWANGNHAPDRKFAARVARLLAAIDQRITDGAFPITRSDTRAVVQDERRRLIRQALS